jgi:phosphomannomutase/phosphoglucomutase
MHEIGSPLGGEVSGHLFIGENYYGFDDAPLVALKALSIFSQSDKSVSEIFGEFPNLFATPEIILSAPDNLKFGMIDEMVEIFSDKYEVVTLDGVRASFDNGWGMVRASNTQPAITLRFESYSKEDLVKYMKIFKEQLDKHPEVDQSKLDAQIERFSS